MYALSTFIINGFKSVNKLNRAGVPGPPSVARPILLVLLFILRDGLMFSCRVDLMAVPAMRSGIITVCTGVMPPKVVLLPPQNPLAARHRDIEGRSLCILGVSKDDKDAVL